MKYILNSNWKSSNFYLLPNIHRSEKIVEETNERNNICLNMQPPEDLKGIPIVGGPNSPTQGINGQDFRENINPCCSMFENIYKGWLGFY